MSGRNGIAGRRGGLETASAPVSEPLEGDGMNTDTENATETARATVRLIADRAKRCGTLAELDALAADAEDAAQYIPEGGDGALAEAVRSEMLAAIDERRELLAERAAHAETLERCAEALRLARAGVTLAADAEARRQQAEAEKRGAMETARAVGAFGDALQKDVAKWADVTVRSVKNWEAWEKKGLHDKLPRLYRSDGSIETYSRRIRHDRLACKTWCELYKLQEANARRTRGVIGR